MVKNDSNAQAHDPMQLILNMDLIYDKKYFSPLNNGKSTKISMLHVFSIVLSLAFLLNDFHLGSK